MLDNEQLSFVREHLIMFAVTQSMVEWGNWQDTALPNTPILPRTANFSLHCESCIN